VEIAAVATMTVDELLRHLEATLAKVDRLRPVDDGVIHRVARSVCFVQTRFGLRITKTSSVYNAMCRIGARFCPAAALAHALAINVV
jgi:hypothetical protein